ncbi:MAG TPA: peptidylprolyl isomerase [Polyangiaceae bacterium]|nr:peptidylprolyl isomerase [Polyangiaceae bacterium]
MKSRPFLVLGPIAFASVALACQSSPAEPTGKQEPAKQEPAKAAPSQTAAAEKATPTAVPAAKPAAAVPVSPDDPLKGSFSMSDATQGIAGSGSLFATIETDLGKLECKLFEDKAPLTVANFVGLARGTRPWKDPEGKWVKKAAYDGTVFHRIIKGFMIQGGDAKGTGSGEPGYVVPDELWEGAKHDRAGLLCMANRGPNTNGAQFFITDASAPHLDRGYTIFGECTPEDMVHKLASVEVQGERPKSPPKIKSIKIHRGGK